MILSDDVGGVCQDASRTVFARSASVGQLIIAGRVKSRDHALGQIALLGDRPLVVALQEHCSGEALPAASSGKMPTTSVRRLICLVTRCRGLVDQILRQWLTGKA